MSRIFWESTQADRAKRIAELSAALRTAQGLEDDDEEQENTIVSYYGSASLCPRGCHYGTERIKYLGEGRYKAKCRNCGYIWEEQGDLAVSDLVHLIQWLVELLDDHSDNTSSRVRGVTPCVEKTTVQRPIKIK